MSQVTTELRNKLHELLKQSLQSNLCDRAICYAAQVDNSTSTTVYSRLQWADDVIHLAQHLPTANYAINICHSRYNFLLSVMAVILRDQCNLLPSDRSKNTQEQLESFADSPDSTYVIDDDYVNLKRVMAVPDAADLFPIKSISHVDSAAPVIIVFTSGSTGTPQPYPKTWAMLCSGAKLMSQRFLYDETQENHCWLGTVAHQHMYGLETLIIPAILGYTAIYDATPFFPADIENCCQIINKSITLITTPIHLKALKNEMVNLQQSKRFISATAPLSLELAKELESQYRIPAYEIYGCTEAGSIASRRVSQSALWQCYSGFTIAEEGQEGSTHYVVNAPHLPQSYPLQDNFVVQANGQFSLAGRIGDMIKVAGKRASLSGLNAHLQNIDQVIDGHFYMDHKQQRPQLLVVTSLDKQALTAALKQCIDSAFIPRNIRFVDKLPRNAMGKIQCRALEELALQDAT